MNIEKCDIATVDLLDAMCGHPRKFSMRSPLFFPRDKYSAQPLKDALKDLVSESSSGEYFSQPNEDMCRT